MMSVDFSEFQSGNISSDAKLIWPRLTKDDLVIISEDVTKLIGKIAERYGKSNAEAEREVEEWLASCRL